MDVGAVFRDNIGQCLLAVSEPLPGFSSPEMAEAMALRRVMTIAGERGFEKVIFATDCLSLAQHINSTESDRSMVGVVVR
jgi:hypothetical protein